jgi:hypothetical protein
VRTIIAAVLAVAATSSTTLTDVRSGDDVLRAFRADARIRVVNIVTATKAFGCTIKFKPAA